MRLDFGPAADLAPGTMKGLPVEGPLERVVVANVDGALRAFGGICSHAYAELDRGFLRGPNVLCPLHFSEFDTATGEVLTPPADGPLPVFPVKVEGGSVIVELPEA